MTDKLGWTSWTFQTKDAGNFDVSREDDGLIERIVYRAEELYRRYGLSDTRLHITLDITVTHVNGCPLDLGKLLAADAFTFAHDVLGIRRHLNRQTGKLEDCFVPRCASREPTCHAVTSLSGVRIGTISPAVGGWHFIPARPGTRWRTRSPAPLDVIVRRVKKRFPSATIAGMVGETS